LRKDSAARELHGISPMREIVRRVRTVFREEGFRGVVRTYGWKAVAGVFVYYLVRDVTLYIVIPYLAIRGFSS